MWHQRLGHPHIQVVDKLKSNKLIVRKSISNKVSQVKYWMPPIIYNLWHVTKINLNPPIIYNFQRKFLNIGLTFIKSITLPSHFCFSPLPSRELRSSYNSQNSLLCSLEPVFAFPKASSSWYPIHLSKHHHISPMHLDNNLLSYLQIMILAFLILLFPGTAPCTFRILFITNKTLLTQKLLSKTVHK